MAILIDVARSNKAQMFKYLHAMGDDIQKGP